MYIHEAVKKALEEGKCITRKPGVEDSIWSITKLEPTNGLECVIIHTSRTRHLGPRTRARWQPIADDLMAGDWEVVD